MVVGILLIFSVNNTKTYRFSCWFKENGVATVTSDGRMYFGLHGYGTTNGVYARSTGTGPNTNPYFDSTEFRLMPSNTWLLFVAHVWPAGSGSGANHADSKVYAINGDTYSWIADYVWHPSTTSGNQRSYMYYSITPGVECRFVYPRVEIVDGSEPSIDDLLNGFGAASVLEYDFNQGNFYARSSGDMGQVGGTGYYSAITPPVGGYTLYKYKPDRKGPAIYTPDNDASLIWLVNRLSENSFTTISQTTTFLNSNSEYAYFAG